jgi:alkane 1-monooxygenase
MKSIYFMNIRALKFAAPLSIYVLAWFAFHEKGWVIAWPILFAFAFVPIVEILFPAAEKNMSDAEEQIAKEDRLYDLWLYLIVPLQYYALYLFFTSIQDPTLTSIELIGRILVMGLLCGTFGINVGHELGHRRNLYERNLAKALLLTSLYMHFYIEHNKGHHKNVSTKEDPSSARRGEIVYLFYFRSVIMGILSAWHIAADEQKKKGKPVLHFSNQMLQFQLLQLLFVSAIFMFFGWMVLLSFFVAATIGFLLLETINYIEHYGLERRKTEKGYERTMPEHSWNSSHVLGRLILFELSRHSDHHYLASRKYQILRHHDHAPQMPTGYPGMVILSLFPPLWFAIMNRRIDRYQLMVAEPK